MQGVNEVVAKPNNELPQLDDNGYLLHMEDLLHSYINTKKMLLTQKKKLKQQIEQSVGMGIKDLRSRKNAKFFEKWLEENELLWKRYGSTSSSITGVDYIIKWLQIGKEPGSIRGIEKRSIYQRTVLVDPSLIERYINPINSRSASTLTEEKKEMLRDALAALSDREREVFILSKGEMFTHEQIAMMLNISKGAVDQMVSRAHKKISEGWQGSLF